MNRNDECRRAIWFYVHFNPGQTIYAVKEHFRTQEIDTNYGNFEVRARINELLNEGKLVKGKGQSPKYYGSTKIYTPDEKGRPDIPCCGNCMRYDKLPHSNPLEFGDCTRLLRFPGKEGIELVRYWECCSSWIRARSTKLCPWVYVYEFLCSQCGERNEEEIDVGSTVNWLETLTCKKCGHVGEGMALGIVGQLSLKERT